MRVELGDLSRSLAEERADLLTAMAAVVDSGWLVHGPQHAAFERELADLVGASHALGVASGTDALELALKATMPPGRSAVATVANAGGYTTTAALRAGLDVALVDIEPEALLIDPTDVARVLAERADVGVVVVTHLFGRAADVAAVRAVAAPHGVAVVEDCAQAIGARTATGPVGSLADAAAFSFYPTKNLGALGDGGAITTTRADVVEAVAALRQYGWGAKYEVTLPGGVNSRLDEIQAAVLRTRLPRLAAGNARRREIAATYSRAASPRLRVVASDGPEYVGHLGVVETAERAALTDHLDAAGIAWGIHYPVPDHRQPAWAARFSGVSLPRTEAAAERILTIPLHPELRPDEVERVGRALATF